MSSLFESREPPRVAERHRLGPVRIAEISEWDDYFARFNARLAVRITNAVGTMTCAYLFAALALVSLPATIESHSVLVIVAWVAQTFLQLILLSVIMVGQKVQAVAADKRSEQMYHDVSVILDQIRQVHEHLDKQDEVLAPPVD